MGPFPKIKITKIERNNPKCKIMLMRRTKRVEDVKKVTYIR